MWKSREESKRGNGDKRRVVLEVFVCASRITPLTHADVNQEYIIGCISVRIYPVMLRDGMLFFGIGFYESYGYPYTGKLD